MGFGADIRRSTGRIADRQQRIARRTFMEVGEHVVRVLSPYGDPDSWKSPPPADYRPGNFRNSWFYSMSAPTGAKTAETGPASLPNDIERLPAKPGGFVHYLSNSAPHAGAMETGHSRQAPQGVIEFVGPAFSLTIKRVAAEER